MKIFFAGGGTGGHFYPIIAVAQEIHRIAEERRFVSVEMYMLGDKPLDAKILRDEEIAFISIPAGKIRRYFSLRNFTDIFLTMAGIGKALWYVYRKIPDVVFAKGGYASFPTIIAARMLGIQVMIHESDSVPGLVTRWASKFAHKIAISFPDSAQFFPEKKIILVGNPIRRGVIGGNEDEARDLFKIAEDIPVLLVLGGSQGAQVINDVVLEALPELIKKYHVIHQTGEKNLPEIIGRATIILENHPYKDRYLPFGFLDTAELRSASYISSLIISRSGGNIFEIAAWVKPSILIPIKSSAQDHQRSNAYQYANTGAAIVIEEENLAPHILRAQIDKIVGDTELQKTMSSAAKAFSRPDAAKIVAEEIIRLGSHGEIYE